LPAVPFAREADHVLKSPRLVVLAIAGAFVVFVGAGVTYSLWPGSDCSAGPSDRALRADTDLADATIAARNLDAVGIDVDPRWSVRGDSPGRPGGEWEPLFTAAAVAGDVVVIGQQPDTGWFGSNSTVLAAYDARTGATRWQVEGSAVHDSRSLLPGAAGQLLLLDNERDGDLTAIHAATGAVAWCIDGADEEWGAELVTAGPGRIVLLSFGRDVGSGSTLRALDPATGDDLWHVGFDGTSRSPVLAGDVVLVHADPDDGGGDDELRAYDAATGDLRWTAPAGNAGEPTGGAAAAIVATGDGDGRHVTALDPRTGEQMWTVDVGRDGSADGTFRVLDVIDEGVLMYVDTGFVLFDATTGATRWTAPGLIDSSFATGPLVLHDPTRLLLRRKDELASVDVATGAVSATPSDVFVFTTSPSGEVVVTLASALDDSVRVDVLTGGP
jgi:outer membrane protein assembly factor BamB